MKVVFFGTASFSVPVLEALHASRHECVACITQPDRPAGRGRKLQAPPLKQAALRLGIRVEQPRKLLPETTRLFDADAGVLAAFGRFIPQTVLDAFPHGIIGVHPSLLPAYRGAAPTVWALLHGEGETGVTTYRLDAGMDSGPLLLQERETVREDDNSESLAERLSRLGANLLVRTLDAIERGQIKQQPQNESAASYGGKLSKEMSPLDWSQPAAILCNRVRALYPWPGTTARWQGKLLKIHAVRVGDAASRSAPGTVLAAGKEGIDVAAGEGSLRITVLQPEGKRAMQAREFLAGHALKAGQILT